MYGVFSSSQAVTWLLVFVVLFSILYFIAVFIAELYATFGSRTDKKKKDKAKVCLAVVRL